MATIVSLEASHPVIRRAEGVATILAIGKANPFNYVRVLSEEIINENPSFRSYNAVSLNARHDLKIEAMPKLGERTAIAAIKEWVQPKSKITYIIVNSTSRVDMPGTDYQLIHSLRLNKSVNRILLYHQGCFAGDAVLHIAKDLAENNPGLRVLIVFSELTITTFCGPCEDDLADLVGQAIFAD